jgi:hypothetical protein
MDLRPYTDTDWDSLPHVFFNAEDEWDTTVMDHEFKMDWEMMVNL